MFSVIIYLIFSVLFGILYCFFGRRYFYPLLMISVLANCIYVGAVQMRGGFFVILLSAIIGIALALLARLFYKVGLFFMGLSAGAVVGTIVAGLLVIPFAIFFWPIVIAFAVMFGIFAVIWSDTFITISTAIKGSSMIVSVVGFLIWNTPAISTFAKGGFFSTIMSLSTYFSTELVKLHPVITTIATFILFLIGWSYQRKDKHNVAW